MTKNFIGEKEKRTNKGNDKHEDADSLYTIQEVVLNVYTIFQNPR